MNTQDSSDKNNEYTLDDMQAHSEELPDEKPRPWDYALFYLVQGYDFIMVKHWWKTMVVCFGLTIVLLLASCGTTDGTQFEEGRDAGVSGRNEEPAFILHMPDTFSNVAIKCHGTTEVAVTRGDIHGRSIAIAADSPNCQGGGGED